MDVTPRPLGSWSSTGRRHGSRQDSADHHPTSLARQTRTAACHPAHFAHHQLERRDSSLCPKPQHHITQPCRHRPHSSSQGCRSIRHRHLHLRTAHHRRGEPDLSPVDNHRARRGSHHQEQGDKDVEDSDVSSGGLQTAADWHTAPKSCQRDVEPHAVCQP